MPITNISQRALVVPMFFGPIFCAGLCLDAFNRLDHLIVSLAPDAPVCITLYQWGLL
jgi:hypothetical protein